jgi:hypothetical protein
VAIGACGDTVQHQPIPHNILEGLIVAPQPVYWLGGSFQGMAISEATHDPGGAYSVQYGNCLQGGQGTCVPPLRVVSSPDNSFLPGGSVSSRAITVRGLPARLAQRGRTIVIPTGSVVVDVYASNARMAGAAAARMVPINEPGAPEAALPVRLPDSGFADRPLPSQVPSPLQPLR